MRSDGPLSTPYGDGIVDTPSPSEATTKGEDVTLNEGGAQGLIGTPFEKPLTRAPGQNGTGNMSEIPDFWNTTPVPDGPKEGTTVEVIGEVKTPNVPAGNITGGMNLGKNTKSGE
jgi:hypothetical protein